MATNRGEAATNRKPVASIFCVRGGAGADDDREQAQTYTAFFRRYLAVPVSSSNMDFCIERCYLPSSIGTQSAESTFMATIKPL